MKQPTSAQEYRFEWINTDEKREKLQTFAKSFDHEVKSFTHPIAAFKRGETWVGYSQIVLNMPVVFFAWNPNTIATRDLHEFGSRFMGWSDLQHGGGFTAAPINQPTKFNKELVERHFGVKSMGMELYERVA